VLHGGEAGDILNRHGHAEVGRTWGVRLGTEGARTSSVDETVMLGYRDSGMRGPRQREPTRCQAHGRGGRALVG